MLGHGSETVCGFKKFMFHPIETDRALVQEIYVGANVINFGKEAF